MFPRCSFSTTNCTLSIDKVVIKADFVLNDSDFFSTLQMLFYPCDCGIPVRDWFSKYPNFKDDTCVTTDLAVDANIGLLERNNKSVIDEDVTLFPVKVDKFVSFHNLSYNWLYNISSLTDDSAGLVIGFRWWDIFKGGDNTQIKFEYNPNKIVLDDSLVLLLRRLLSMCKLIELQECDYAFDVPFARSLFSLVPKDNQIYSYIRSYSGHRLGVTEYIGKKHTNGYCKLYDKAVESCLDGDLTRFEVTCKGKAHDYTVSHCFRSVIQRSTLPFEFSDTDKVLYNLISKQEMPAEYINALGRRQKEKFSKLFSSPVSSLFVIDFNTAFGLDLCWQTHKEVFGVGFEVC